MSNLRDTSTYHLSHLEKGPNKIPPEFWLFEYEYDSRKAITITFLFFSIEICTIPCEIEPPLLNTIIACILPSRLLGTQSRISVFDPGKIRHATADGQKKGGGCLEAVLAVCWQVRQTGWRKPKAD